MLATTDPFGFFFLRLTWCQSVLFWYSSHISGWIRWKAISRAQMVNLVTIMKWLLILCGIAVASATYVKTSGSPCSIRQDPVYLRTNAENQLFLEYLRRQASENDLYGWKSVMDTDDYQGRLNEIRVVNENCDSGDDVFERINVLEGRLSNCGETVNCGRSCATNCDDGGKWITLQNELRRQKLMIQRLYSQILVLSQNNNNCDSKSIIYYYNLILFSYSRKKNVFNI